LRREVKKRRLMLLFDWEGCFVGFLWILGLVSRMGWLSVLLLSRLALGVGHGWMGGWHGHVDRYGSRLISWCMLRGGDDLTKGGDLFK
jgi:hypothetical protein